MKVRGDTLVASSFTLAELLVAPLKQGDHELERAIKKFFGSGEVEVVTFDIAAAERFASIRAERQVSAADAIHLACASSAKVDLFLTNDKSLRRLVVPGIAFIECLETSVFDA